MYLFFFAIQWRTYELSILWLWKKTKNSAAVPSPESPRHYFTAGIEVQEVPVKKQLRRFWDAFAAARLSRLVQSIFPTWTNRENPHSAKLNFYPPVPFLIDYRGNTTQCIFDDSWHLRRESLTSKTKSCNDCSRKCTSAKDSFVKTILFSAIFVSEYTVLAAAGYTDQRYILIHILIFMFHLRQSMLAPHEVRYQRLLWIGSTDCRSLLDWIKEHAILGHTAVTDIATGTPGNSFFELFPLHGRNVSPLFSITFSDCFFPPAGVWLSSLSLADVL